MILTLIVVASSDLNTYLYMHARYGQSIAIERTENNSWHVRIIFPVITNHY
jgi:hypothetical protein